ncbi:MAG TPA: GNAT family N-acetyltransferase [Nocardioides sp.]|nr:GNAT family N-acetyltransferase [Nocardioides sp.]
MPPTSEAHGLGPHVVGQRVVVRRILPGETGPSGGPAMTDLLGVCTSWGDGWCVVQPEVGDPVRIALADIVSGKPVPPRPPTRHRISPVDAQRRALALWPGLRTEPLGDWLLRSSTTETARRANSALAFPGTSYEARSLGHDSYDVARVVEHYEGLGKRPIVAVLADSAEDALFRSAGWVLESIDADTLFQIAGVAQVRRALRGLGSRQARPAVADSGVEVEVTVQGGLATARIGDVAGGVAAYDRDWVGFRGIEVDPDRQREGLGLAVMAALVDWGAEQGATTAYLQVIADNVPALTLYERLGFTTHHAYRYLAPR